MTKNENSIDLADLNVKVAIAFALLLIVFFLFYIAFLKWRFNHTKFFPDCTFPMTVNYGQIIPRYKIQQKFFAMNSCCPSMSVGKSNNSSSLSSIPKKKPAPASLSSRYMIGSNVGWLIRIWPEKIEKAILPDPQEDSANNEFVCLT